MGLKSRFESYPLVSLATVLKFAELGGKRVWPQYSSLVFWRVESPVRAGDPVSRPEMQPAALVSVDEAVIF